MQTKGNTILITGGSSGIGWAFAEELYKRGNTVIICGRRADKLAAIQNQYPGLTTYTCDVANAQQRIALAGTILKEHPAINILMNNAGVQYAFDFKNEVDMTKVENEIATNITAYMHFCSLFTKHLATQQNAAIMNISSGLAFAPLAFMPVYCATKAAIHSFTMSLRHQLKDVGVKVFEIIPPSTDTQLGHERWSGHAQSHGGLPVHEFLIEAMLAIENDLLEAPIADAKGLRAKGEAMFPIMNH